MQAGGRQRLPQGEMGGSNIGLQMHSGPQVRNGGVHVAPLKEHLTEGQLYLGISGTELYGALQIGLRRRNIA